MQPNAVSYLKVNVTIALHVRRRCNDLSVLGNQLVIGANEVWSGSVVAKVEGGQVSGEAMRLPHVGEDLVSRVDHVQVTPEERRLLA